MGCEKMLQIKVVIFKKLYKFYIKPFFDRNNSFSYKHKKHH